MSTIQELTSQILAFRDARNWAQFHKPKDIILSLLLEAGELAEHVQWKSEAEFAQYLEEHRAEIGHELADVLYWVLLIGHDFGIDLVAALKEKLAINAQKYPVEKAKGCKEKYSRLHSPLLGHTAPMQISAESQCGPKGESPTNTTKIKY